MFIFKTFALLKLLRCQKGQLSRLVGLKKYSRCGRCHVNSCYTAFFFCLVVRPVLYESCQKYPEYFPSCLRRFFFFSSRDSWTKRNMTRQFFFIGVLLEVLISVELLSLSWSHERGCSLFSVIWCLQLKSSTNVNVWRCLSFRIIKSSRDEIICFICAERMYNSVKDL